MADESDLETRPLQVAPSAGRTLPLKEGHLVVVEGPDKGRRFVFASGRVRIGTKDDNDIVLTDDTVSKHHLCIDEVPEGFLLRDLGSRNGTFHENLRIREAFLTPGSSIRLGGTVLRFEPPDQKTTVIPSSRTSFGDVRGESARIRELFGLLEKAAPTDLTILIRGETGTGKEVVAHSIHRSSRRADGPFVVFDCSAIPKDLMESALFGHKEGAFSGAVSRRKGAFLSAHTGTLFLDEIGELDLELQPKLLRVLEKREVQQLGSDQVSKVDVRVVGATHRDLREMVRHGQFRQDLFYRVSIVELVLPALRDRRDDIPLLVEHFLELAGAAGHIVTDPAMECLRKAPWVGNVRELKNVVDRALAFAGDDPIDTEHLVLGEDLPRPGDAGSVLSGDRSLEEVEATAILATLTRTSWNKSQAARILGITRKTLLDKIERYKLKP